MQYIDSSDDSHTIIMGLIGIFRRAQCEMNHLVVTYDYRDQCPVSCSFLCDCELLACIFNYRFLYYISIHSNHPTFRLITPMIFNHSSFGYCISIL